MNNAFENYECEGQYSIFDFIPAPDEKQNLNSVDLTATKFFYEVKEISKEECLTMVKKYHYSNTLPRINKHYLGFFLGGGSS